MKTYTAPFPKAPPSAHDRPWDPWVSSSTGHQRREVSRGDSNPGETETSWRSRRNHMINRQFLRQDGSNGSNDAPREEEEEQLRLRPKATVAEMLAKPGKMRENMGQDKNLNQGGDQTQESKATGTGTDASPPAGRRIFEGLVVYVNGSTFPLISDHRLKRVLCENGAHMSLHLGRRQITHVIMGRATASSGYSTLGATSHQRPQHAAAAGASRSPTSLVGSAGGGLAGRKMEKEIRRVGGCGIKYVGVEWVLESIRAGRRLPEARFSNHRIAASGQGSVYGLSTLKDVA